MKHKGFERKSVCKNKPFPVSKKYMSLKWRKTPCIAAVWGRHYAGKSDKESSHVVGKISKAGVR